MLAASTEKSIRGIRIDELIAILGYMVFIVSKCFGLFTNVALIVYILACTISFVIWYAFTPHTALKNLPQTICHFQGKYFLSPMNTNRKRYKSNLSYVIYTFPEYLRNSVVKQINRIEIFDATQIECKHTTLALLVDTRCEDTYNLLIANILKSRPSAVISVNKRDCNNLFDLRTDSQHIKQLISKEQPFQMIKDYSICAFETWLSGQATFAEAI